MNTSYTSASEKSRWLKIKPGTEGGDGHTVAAIIIEMHLPVPLPVPVQFQSSYFQITMASIWTCPYGSHSYLEIPGLELDWNWKWNWQMHFNNYSCYCREGSEKVKLKKS